MLTRFFAVVLTLWLAALLPQAVGAHASLVSVTPPNGVLSEAPPDRIEMTFSESVGPLRVALIAPDGTVRAVTAAVAGGPVRTIPLDGITQRGTFVLTWRVASEDGHPVDRQPFGVTAVFRCHSRWRRIADPLRSNAERHSAWHQSRRLAKHLWLHPAGETDAVDGAVGARRP